MQCGNIVYKAAQTKKHFNNLVKTCFTDFVYKDETMQINDIYKEIINDYERNKKIAADIEQAITEKRSIIVLTERTEHAQILYDLLKDKTKNLFLITGKMRNKDIKIILENIKNSEKTEELVIISTGKYIGEGFDEARLDTLFLTMPISWKGTLIQYAGRLNRDYENKKDVIIYDYADIKVPVLEKMYKRRLKGYKLLNYEFFETEKQLNF